MGKVRNNLQRHLFHRQFELLLFPEMKNIHLMTIFDLIISMVVLQNIRIFNKQ